ncbi:MAG: TIGR03435 family protein [Terracidiphilus sp.]
MSMFTCSNRLSYIGVLCAVTCLLAAGASSNCQQPSNAPMIQGRAPAPMAFDKVMFYPDTAADNGDGFLWWGIPNYWTFANVSSLNLIANAYGLGMHQIIGFPDWAETDRYNLEANMDLEKFEAFKTMPMNEQLRQQRLMMQAVLADRYQLRAHLETREMPVYELVIAHGGPKLREKVSDGRPGASFFQPRNWWGNYGTMEDLASKLSGPTGGVVIDKTGLGTKTFNYFLKWTSDSQSGAAGGAPSIFTALEDQLGLKLVPATGRVEVLVIDHIEKPTPIFQFEATSGASK